ncbi:39S ribosomal protein L35, mitochondrial-like [Mercenaria mercenaria]|uniref:39S ribosomal protein L35, mitochondrial-like n=1 Tax=Mercenaria mercenaria TaxID=6596 RepID=UPI00234E7CE5|nr:39S ribosomal protein L35, mitochondrial-like [Mercenaria mercenaria]
MAASLVRKLAGTLATNLSHQGTPASSASTLLQRCLGRNPGTTCLPVQRCFSQWTYQAQPKLLPQKTGSLLQVCQPFVNSRRTAVRYGVRTGLPKTVKAVPGRFFRLPWGIYIRTRAGRHKKKWAKPDWINERGKYHVFCNKQQSKMLDKMTTDYWKKRRYYVNDPYEPYMKRTDRNYTPPKFLP